MDPHAVPLAYAPVPAEQITPYVPEVAREPMRQPFRIGRVLSRSVSLFTRQFFAYMTLGMLIHVPLFLYLALVLSDEQMFIDATESWGYVFIGSYWFLGQILTATIIDLTIRQLRGEPTSIGHSLKAGVRMLPAVFMVTVLWFVLIGFGFVLLVIPGFVLLCASWVVIPALVVERAGIFGSFGRSGELTRGHRWRVFGLLLLLGVFGALTGSVLESMFLTDPTIDDVKLYMVVSVVWSVVTSVLGSVVNAVGYHDLRAAKETVDFDQVRAVFE